MKIAGVSLSQIGIYAAIVIVVAGVGYFVWARKHKPSKLDLSSFKARWQEAQKLCGKEDTWPLAIINADKLVEDALRKRKYKGKTMGEKLVSAQHDIQDNDAIWFAHKLRNKLVHEDLKKLKKKDVLEALIGFRETLKDLGALE